MKRIGLALVVVVAATGCGGSDHAPTPVRARTAATSQAGPPHEVRVYFLQNGQVAAARRTVEGSALGAAALAALEQGPTQKEKLGALTSVVSGLGSLSIESGAARVQGFDQLSRGGKAQVVYTLTQFPSVRTVNGAGRREFEDLTPAILVESPEFGATVHSPLRVTGTANTFEATFQYELKDAGGTILAKHFVTATSGSGQRGTFEFTVNFDVEPGGRVPVTLVVYEISAADGSRIHTREIPLNLEP